MRMATSSKASNTVVAVLTADPAFEQSVSTTFGASGAIELRVVRGTVASVDNFTAEGATVVVIDLDTARPEEMVALEHMMLQIGVSPPVVVVTQSFDAEVARSLLQMRVADFLVKPVQPIELVRTCARVARSTVAETKEAQIYTFIPAVGGAGVTTLAIQTALLLLNSGQRVRPTVCLVDHGDRTVAGAIALSHRDVLEVPWASSLREYRSQCPNNLLYWKIIEHGVDTRKTSLDFGRSTPNEGTYHFKQQWGAKPEPLYWEYALQSGRELPNLSPSNPKYRAAINLWTRLPVGLTKVIGPHIVRSIP